MFARTRLRSFVPWIAAGVLSACGDGGTPPPEKPAAVDRVVVTGAADQVVAGRTVVFTATPEDAERRALTDRAVTWSSADPAVATVSGGTVTGVAPGTTLIRATAGGVTGQKQVTVTPAPVARVVMTPQGISRVVGDTAHFIVTVYDADGHVLTDRPVTLFNTDTTVVRVQAGFVVTALRAGSVMLTAYSEGQAAQSTFVVLPARVASLEVVPGSFTIEVGDTAHVRLVARDSAGNELPGRASAVVGNPAVATLQDGVIRGTGPGLTALVATAGELVASAEIVVVPVTAPPASIAPPKRRPAP